MEATDIVKKFVLLLVKHAYMCYEKKIYKKKVNTIVVVQSVPVAHAHAITSTENF